jgi:hypothetical protein
MKKMYIHASDLDNIIEVVEVLDPKDRETVLILLAEEQMCDITKIMSSLNERGINFMGGIFPRIIHGENVYNSGAIIRLLSLVSKPLLVTGLSTNTLNVQQQLSDFKVSNGCTSLILVDGLSTSISFFLSSVFQQFGTSVKYFGGGAGSLSLRQQPCIFCPEGIFMDAAIIAFIDMDSELGIRHGWKRIIGPLVATRSEGNVVKELNWSNAFAVYKQAVEQDSGLKFNEHSFFDIAKGYPFGIYSEGSEDIVRDPIQVTEEGELICVGEVPENAVLNILKGEKPSLIASAGQAMKDCFITGSKDIKYCMIMDCISRVLFLEEDFKEELMSISKEIRLNGSFIVPEGALTLGEIASRKHGILEFFNKTIVVGAFRE